MSGFTTLTARASDTPSTCAWALISRFVQNCRVINANVLEWGMSGEVDARSCFFLGMELLDNLPHDKISWTTPSPSKEVTPPPDESSSSSQKRNNNEQLCEAIVVSTPTGFREEFRPLRDPVIRELLTLCPELVAQVKGAGDGGSPTAGGPSPNSLWNSVAWLLRSGNIRPDYHAAFVPTGSLRLVQALRKRLPRHRAILADFDSFAGSVAELDSGQSGGVAASAPAGGAVHESLMAFHAPIVSSRDPVTGKVTDHATYMVPFGSADIFFPTNFERLSRIHAAICARGGDLDGDLGEVRRGRGVVVKQGEFLRQFVNIKATRTWTGYNPLVDDFRNSSFFLSGTVLT